ncbi:phospholipase-like protein [Tanacetum coccineum]
MLRKQHKVDDSHYDMPLIYYIEGHGLHFGHPEFALITGLPFGPISFALYTSGELKFRNRVFPHKLGLSVTNLDVIGVIEDEEIFGKLGDEDSIRLCLILALEVIFMGRLLTCPVDDTLFRFVENLEDWNCFPWDYLVEDELRLCLEDEERMRLEQEKNIIEAQRFRMEEANRMRLEEDKLLQIAEHIDLWVDYMWHERPENAKWAMVSCYFVQLLLQNSTPLFYANGDKYATP